MRKVTTEDFKDKRVIKAQYFGRNKYLINGNWYNIRFMEKRKKVVVALGDNPNLERCNSGAEFSLGTFYIESELKNA